MLYEYWSGGANSQYKNISYDDTSSFSYSQDIVHPNMDNNNNNNNDLITNDCISTSLKYSIDDKQVRVW